MNPTFTDLLWLIRLYVGMERGNHISPTAYLVWRRDQESRRVDEEESEHYRMLDRMGVRC